MIKLFLLSLMLGICTPALSLSVMGSYIEWQTLAGSSGQYKIVLSLYLDATSGELQQQQQQVYLFKNNKHWEASGRWVYFDQFPLNRISSQEVDQDSLRCAGSGDWEDFGGQRHVYLNIYEKTLKLSDLSMIYSNDEIVIAWQCTGTRDGKDINFTNSAGASEWVTTIIPPITVDGPSVRNSSPNVGSLNTFFLCKGDRKSVSLSAFDGDRDNLKYRLCKPSMVYSDRKIISVAPLDWATGYSDQHQVHGNPGLTIDENTGVMTVQSDEPGQYFIGISIEEYRNGQKIGSVSFYYTLTVIDCNQQQALDKHLYTDTTAVTTLSLCEGSDATLTSKQTFPNPQPKFQWTKDGKVIWGETSQSITIHEPGNYQLLTTDINGCPDSFDSESVQVSVASGAEADIDSIPPICDLTAPPIALHATPAGGTFAGPGVAENTFDPRIAGVGRHEVEYVIQGTDACPGSTTKREITVGETPVLHLTEVLYTTRGKPISIGTTDSLDVSYQWTPPDYLNNGNYANPTATPLTNITYTVTATSAFGCTATREVKIRIIEGLMIPDAFTPNNDGINETWELKGIAEYPICEVTIYNRWGEVIFHSIGYQHAFDGTVKGAMQIPGVYAYKIRLTENSPELRGAFTLLR